MHLGLSVTPVKEFRRARGSSPASRQADLKPSQSSQPLSPLLLPPRAFVLSSKCNYMLNICLSIGWIPSICMTRFNAGPAKPAGMTAMPSNHRPRAPGMPRAGPLREGGERKAKRRRRERERDKKGKQISHQFGEGQKPRWQQGNGLFGVLLTHFFSALMHD